MGKRNVIVVTSSDDDEDGVRSTSANRRLSKSKLTPSISRINSSVSKRARHRRHSDSHSQLCRESHREEVNFDALSEDFDEGFQVFRGFPGCERSDKRELWIDKYKPRSFEELAVHKKKVEEVKIWLKERLRPSKEEFRSHALVITGQAGAGKSATVHVIASHLGARLYEWNTPTPTLWQEHIHNSNSGTNYMSKLDEFETFVERIRKYPLLPLSSTGGSKIKPSILLIDDLPHTNGKGAYMRLFNCLHILARSTQIPTIILITEYSKADSADNTTRNSEDLQSSLQIAGACKMAFNPLTANSIKKTLARICREEQHNVTAEQLDQIAKASGGDIRHAITSLQYFCLRPGQITSSSLTPPSRIHSKDESDELNPSADGLSLLFGRDETLSLFHALGKFLHNKRETVAASGFGQDVFLLSERFARLPLKMDAPEEVLRQAHGQARPIADFLYENALDFLSDEAMDDAWAVASYLSDADNLLATSFRSPTRPQTISSKYELDNIAQSSAASVAIRGVLFGNSHPSPPRWHAIRSPKIWQVELSSRRNKSGMLRQKVEAYNNLSSSDISTMATEYMPFLKWLGTRVSEAVHVHQEKMSCDKVEEGHSYLTDMDGQEDQPSGGSESDEIEDW